MKLKDYMERVMSKWDSFYAGVSTTFILSMLISIVTSLNTHFDGYTFSFSSLASVLVFLAAWSMATIAIYKFFVGASK